jgi:hypothetical protein
MRILTYLLLFPFTMHIAYAGESKPMMIEPQIAGTWKVAEAYKQEADDKLTPYNINRPDWPFTDEQLLPVGLEVTFHGDRDPISGDALSIMEIHTSGDKTLCRHPTFGWQTLDCATFPDTIIKEFVLGFDREWSGVGMFKPMGARKHDILYLVQLSGHGWFGEFYVSRDGKSMWTRVVFGQAINGTFVPGTDFVGFQRWMRVKK